MKITQSLFAVAVLVGAAFLAAPVLAEEGEDISNFVFGAGPIYVRNAGHCDDYTGDVSCEEDGFGAKVFLNARFWENFGAEFGYIYVPETFDVKIPASTTETGRKIGESNIHFTENTWYIAGELAYNFYEKTSYHDAGFGVFAKGGANFWKFKTCENYANGPYTCTGQDGIDPMFGAGLTYGDYSGGLQLEYIRLMQKDDQDMENNKDIISVMLVLDI